MLPVYCAIALLLLAFLLYKAGSAPRFVLRDNEIDPDLAKLDPEQADLQRIIDEYDDFNRRFR